MLRVIATVKHMFRFFISLLEQYFSFERARIQIDCYPSLSIQMDNDASLTWGCLRRYSHRYPFEIPFKTMVLRYAVLGLFSRMELRFFHPQGIIPLE